MADFQTAADVLNEAAKLVSGDRGRTHGDKHDNFTKIARVWNAYLRNANPAHIDIRPDQAADLMELMKVARRQSGAFNPDDYVDAAGYAGVAFEARVRENKLKESVASTVDDWATRPMSGVLTAK